MTATANDLSIGDEVGVVVLYPNADVDRDPAGEIGDKVAYIRFDGDYQPAFAEEIEATVANVKDRNLVLVPSNPDDYREDGADGA